MFKKEDFNTATATLAGVVITFPIAFVAGLGTGFNYGAAMQKAEDNAKNIQPMVQNEELDTSLTPKAFD